ncbi:MAG: ECF transporter S component [Actinomycetota bacterium]
MSMEEARRHRSLRTLRRLIAAALLLLVLLGVAGVAPFSRWPINSLLLAILLVALLVVRFEEGNYGAREVAVVGTLAAVGAAGRVFFAAVPGTQPATFIAILAGYVLGPEPGFLEGALIALLSNLFLGHGPWTPWQMLAWGMAGVSGKLLQFFRRERSLLIAAAVLCTSWGFLFGWIMNLWFWASFVYPLTWSSFLAACAASFWFDLLHAAGNLAFVLALWRPMAEMLRRYRERFGFLYLGEGTEAGSGGVPAGILPPSLSGLGGRSRRTRRKSPPWEWVAVGKKGRIGGDLREV